MGQTRQAKCALAPNKLMLEAMHAFRKFGNDPSAGSPTETLLRLLLPLNDQVRSSSPNRAALTAQLRSNNLAKPFNR